MDIRIEMHWHTEVVSKTEDKVDSICVQYWTLYMDSEPIAMTTSKDYMKDFNKVINDAKVSKIDYGTIAE